MQFKQMVNEFDQSQEIQRVTGIIDFEKSLKMEIRWIFNSKQQFQLQIKCTSDKYKQTCIDNPK